MEVIPAVDLRDGKCVRLIQGQYHRQITYGDDPVQQARTFEKAGAHRLHIVDLDGARIGESINFDVIKNIADHVEMKVEVGGGIRNEETIQAMLDAGVDRVIIGTAAVNDFEWFIEMTRKFPDKLVLGLDAKGSRVAVQGWTQESPQHLYDFVKKADGLQLSAIIYTDISKDGMMAGPNFERTKKVAETAGHDVIAAGGVTETSDVLKFTELGVAGIIIGRALYEGAIDLKEAIEQAAKAG